MSIKFTTITSSQDLSKRVYLDESGKLQKVAAAALSEGDFVVNDVKDLNEFAVHLGNTASHQAFTYGIPKSSTGRITTKARANSSGGAVPRDRKHFDWPPGPGILMIDDDSGQPFADFIQLLRDNVPCLKDVDMLLRPSSSSMIYNSETGEEVQGLLNRRAYVVVSSAKSIPEVGKHIDDHLWLAGFGHFKVSASGGLLERNLVDTAVWTPEHLDFVGGAICTPPLAQHKLVTTFSHSTSRMVDTALLPLLSHGQLELITQRKNIERVAKSSAAATARQAYVAARTTEMVVHGGNASAVKNAILSALEKSELGPDFVIHHASGKSMTIRDLLAQPQAYHGTRCSDPLEPTYRNDPRVAYISLLNGHTPYIYSHAHGGVRYMLRADKPKLFVRPGRSAECADELAVLMAESGRVYSRAGNVCEVLGTGETRPLTASAVKQIAGTWLEILKPKSADEEVVVDLPDTVANMLLASSGYKLLPDLNGVLSAPTMSPDGRLINRAGYDHQSKLLLLTLEVEPWPEIAALSPSELETTFEQLWRPFRDFPFENASSRSAMVAAVFTAVCRPTLPTAPAIGFDAPTAGSGKTKLAECLSILACGNSEVTPAVSDEDELRKKITSTLMAAKQVLLLDNVEGNIKSPILAGFLTTPEWSDRVLGGNALMTAPNRLLTLFTGNNLNPLGDLVRRILIVRIDPRMDATAVWQRNFDEDPVQYVRENRQELVAAGLSLLLSFVRAGMPRIAKGRLASFEQWDDLVRQCVVWLGQSGIAGLIDPIQQLRTAATQDPETDSLRNLLSHWHAAFGNTAVEAKTLCMSSHMYGPINDVALDRRGLPSVKVLAQYLRKYRGKVVDGMRIEMISGRSNTAYWRLVGSPAAEGAVVDLGGCGGFGGLFSVDTATSAAFIDNYFPTEKETNPPNPPQPPCTTEPQAIDSGITTGDTA